MLYRLTQYVAWLVAVVSIGGLPLATANVGGVWDSVVDASVIDVTCYPDYYTDIPSHSDDEDQLVVVTYNVHGLLNIFGGESEKKIACAAKMMELRQPDVVLFSELWTTGKAEVVMNNMPSYTVTGTIKTGVYTAIHQSLTKLDAREETKHFNECGGDALDLLDDNNADCLSEKGFNYNQVKKGDRLYHIAATHADADGDNVQDDSSVRAAQFRQVASYLNRQGIRDTDRLIIGGDMNVIRTHSEYGNMLSTLTVQDSDQTLYSLPYTAYNGEWLDYILYRKAKDDAVVAAPSKAFSVMVATERGPYSKSPYIRNRDEELSDHYPVVTAFDFSPKSSATDDNRVFTAGPDSVFDGSEHDVDEGLGIEMQMDIAADPMKKVEKIGVITDWHNKRPTRVDVYGRNGNGLRLLASQQYAQRNRQVCDSDFGGDFVQFCSYPSNPHAQLEIDVPDGLYSELRVVAFGPHANSAFLKVKGVNLYYSDALHVSKFEYQNTQGQELSPLYDYPFDQEWEFDTAGQLEAVGIVTDWWGKRPDKVTIYAQGRDQDRWSTLKEIGSESFNVVDDRICGANFNRPCEYPSTLFGRLLITIPNAPEVERVRIVATGNQRDPAISPIYKGVHFYFNPNTPANVLFPTFSNDCQYRKGFQIPNGHHFTTGLNARGLKTNQLSSVKVPVGFEVRLYDKDRLEAGDDGRGYRILRIDEEARCLLDDDYDFNDKTESLSIRKAWPKYKKNGQLYWYELLLK